MRSDGARGGRLLEASHNPDLIEAVLSAGATMTVHGPPVMNEGKRRARARFFIYAESNYDMRRDSYAQ